MKNRLIVLVTLILLLGGRPDAGTRVRAADGAQGAEASNVAKDITRLPVSYAIDRAGAGMCHPGYLSRTERVFYEWRGIGFDVAAFPAGGPFTGRVLLNLEKSQMKAVTVDPPLSVIRLRDDQYELGYVDRSNAIMLQLKGSNFHSKDLQNVSSVVVDAQGLEPIDVLPPEGRAVSGPDSGAATSRQVK